MPTDVQGRPPPRLGGGRFQVVDTLGDGGTATVYLAWDGERREWCALKALHHRYLKDEEMCRRFAQEAQALQILKHPHIPELVFHDMDAVPPFMVMELARCGSTMDWVRQNGKMPPSMAADVLFQVCQALAEAHAAGIVHRDVKPHNFLLDDQGACKLTDFGIARVTDNTSFTATGSQIGTFSFMAPEQRSDTKSVDLRADIYSVGASLYTLLTAKTSAELFVADTEDELLAELPAPFRPVVIRATRYKPEERYSTILELQTDLMNALSRIPPDQAAYPPLVRPREPLPPGPPKVLPTGKRFEDLEKSLALDTNQPTYVVGGNAPGGVRLGDSQSKEPGDSDQRSSKVIPYYMPARGGSQVTAPPVAAQPAPLRPRPTGDIPDYVDASEVGALHRAEEARRSSKEAEKKAQEDAHAAVQRETARRQEEEEAARTPRQLAIAGAVGLLLLLMVMGVVGYGSWSVHGAATQTAARAEALTAALRADGAVVYDMSADRRVFEELYNRFLDGRGEDRLQAALQFVGELDRLVGSGTSLDPVQEPKVRRLQRARDDYVEARGDWERTARGFPGGVAVSLGIASPP